MAQVAIREYDAKMMFAQYTGIPYSGFFVESAQDLEHFQNSPHSTSSFVIKPDQLFGKRGKYGLVGVNLDIAGVTSWWKEHQHREVTIGKQTGVLGSFLIEPFVPHSEEYYISLKTERDHDVLSFSSVGGINIEDHWDQVQEVRIPLREYDDTALETFFSETLNQKDTRILIFLTQLYRFFVGFGFVSLEINPFTFDSEGTLVCLDMVAYVDSCEAYRQKKHWKNITWVHPFGVEKTPAESYIEELDSQTGASLKFRILNPEGRIWLVTSGGGASVIIADTLADLGFIHEIGNYGELSGNPDRENTRAYADTLVSTMLANGKVGQYLVIAGAIANFTHIDKTFSGIIDVLRAQRGALIEQDIHILVRRGGINDTRGLAMIESACQELGIPCEIADGSIYMTQILQSIQF